MKNGYISALAAPLALLLTSGVLLGQDFRVQLFSNARLSSLALHAGRDAVEVCSLTQPRRCLRVEPLGTARCAVARARVVCSAGNSTLSFRRWSFVSASRAREIDVLGTDHENHPYARGGKLQAAELEARQNELRVVARIGFEAYVAGALEGEAATLNSRAALEAMAVVARTWALRWRGRHRSDGFDFCSLTHCQAFRLPTDAPGDPSAEIAAAVQATRGKILKYQGRLIDPYFSAHCGGVTEAAGEIWPDRAAPYLRSFSDPYCAASGSFSWQRSVPLEAVELVLRRDLALSFQAPLQDLSVEARDSSGRVRVLLVRSGARFEVDGNLFRFTINRRLGWNTLKSNLYKCEQRNGEVVFTGRGLGHGVGLCQAGAEQMGRLGIAYPAILETYFPGTALGQADAADGAASASSEHFELVYPPDQQSWVNETLEALEASRRQLGERARTLPAVVRVRAYESTAEFMRATGRPGWAAASSGSETIQLQPLSTLDRKGILRKTLRHELYHVALHPLRAPQVPAWFEEGLVEFLTGERLPVPRQRRDPGADLERMLSSPRSEPEMRSAYAWALDRVKQLAREHGEPALWRVLEHPTADDLRWLNAKEKPRT